MALRQNHLPERTLLLFFFCVVLQSISPAGSVRTWKETFLPWTPLAAQLLLHPNRPWRPKGRFYSLLKKLSGWSKRGSSLLSCCSWEWKPYKELRFPEKRGLVCAITSWWRLLFVKWLAEIWLLKLEEDMVLVYFYSQSNWEWCGLLEFLLAFCLFYIL